MFLTTLSHGALGRLEFLLRNPQQGSMSASTITDQKPKAGVGTRAPPSSDIGIATSYGPKAKDIWGQIGHDLSHEGITAEDMQKFEKDVKAYMRYLVTGRTPFWADSHPDKRRSAAMAREGTDSQHVSFERVHKSSEPTRKGRERIEQEIKQLEEQREQMRKEHGMQKKERFESYGLTDEEDGASHMILRLESLFEFDKTDSTPPDRPGEPNEHEDIILVVPSPNDDRRSNSSGRHTPNPPSRHTCDRCNLPIGGVRVHCQICQRGNYDICEACWNRGKHCLNREHRLKLIDERSRKG